MKWLGRMLCLSVIVLFAAMAVSAEVAEGPELPGELRGHVEGVGTHLAIEDSDYLNVVLDSTEVVSVSMDSVPEMVTVLIESGEGAETSEVTLSGFVPETTYHLYQDDYHNHVAFVTDGYGCYTYVQDLAVQHVVFIQPKESTIYLSSAGWSAPVGSWDPVTQTGTLTQDVFETIQIDSDGVTLDGNGYSCDGSGSGNGLYMNGRTGVTVSDLTVEGFPVGMYLFHCSGNTISGNTVSVTSNGIMVIGGSGNTVAGNTVSGGKQAGGICLGGSVGNTVSGNTTTGNFNGVYLSISDGNTLTGNTTRLNSYNGMQLSHATGNVISGNTIGDNSSGPWGWSGIYMVVSPGNTVEGNEIQGNAGHGIAMWLDCSGNTIQGNTISDNGRAGVKFYVDGNSNNLIKENTFENNGHGFDFDAYHDWGPNAGNQVYNNNFIANTVQARGDVSGGGVNIFNLARPTGGNYWSNWTSPDADSDGFVDNPFVFPAGQDDLPLTQPFGTAPPDTTPPTTSISVLGTSGDNGWYVSDVDVTLAGVDEAGGSGVKSTEYSFDGTTWLDYAGPVTVSAEGVTTLYYRSTDNADNVEVAKSWTIKIDKTPPTINGATVGSPNAAGWFNGDVVVHFTASDAVSGIATVTPDVTVTAEGVGQSVTGTAVDNAGNSADATVFGIDIDKTLPEIVIGIPAEEGVYILGVSVAADWSASDSLSGIASATGSVPSGSPLDTSTVGTYTFQVAAVDAADNTGTASCTYHIRYVYSGVLQPINPDGSSVFKYGRTVPVKLQLTDASGAYVTDATVRIYLAKISDGVIGTEMEASSTSAASTGNTFRYDPEANQYIFNLGTRDLSKGTWQARIEVSDGASYFVVFSLR